MCDEKQLRALADEIIATRDPSVDKIADWILHALDLTEDSERDMRRRLVMCTTANEVVYLVGYIQGGRQGRRLRQ